MGTVYQPLTQICSSTAVSHNDSSLSASQRHVHTCGARGAAALSSCRLLSTLSGCFYPREQRQPPPSPPNHLFTCVRCYSSSTCVKKGSTLFLPSFPAIPHHKNRTAPGGLIKNAQQCSTRHGLLTRPNEGLCVTKNSIRQRQLCSAQQRSHQCRRNIRITRATPRGRRDCCCVSTTTAAQDAYVSNLSAARLHTKRGTGRKPPPPTGGVIEWGKIWYTSS